MSYKYRRQPIVVDAVQFKGNFDAIERFCGGDAEFRDGELVVATPQGALHALDGTYIIKHSNGEFSTCPAEIFESEYDPIGLSYDAKMEQMFNKLGGI